MKSFARRYQLRSRGRLYPIVATLAVSATLFAATLALIPLARGLLPPLSSALDSPISAASLLLVGFSYFTAQLLIQRTVRGLLRHGLTAAAFVLWGVDQLLPQGALAETIGHLVILLYVVDLGLILREQLSGSREL